MQGHSPCALKITLQFCVSWLQLSFAVAVFHAVEQRGAVFGGAFFLPSCSEGDVFLSIRFDSNDWYWITFLLFESSKLRIRLWLDRFERKSMSDCSEGNLCISFRFYSKKWNGLVLIFIVFVCLENDRLGSRNPTMTGWVRGNPLLQFTGRFIMVRFSHGWRFPQISKQCWRHSA